MRNLTLAPQKLVSGDPPFAQLGDRRQAEWISNRTIAETQYRNLVDIKYLGVMYRTSIASAVSELRTHGWQLAAWNCFSLELPFSEGSLLTTVQAALDSTLRSRAVGG